MEPLKTEPGGITAFDPKALGRYLVREVPGLSGPLEVEPIAGGQSNPTYFVKIGERDLVLRKKPPGKLLPSAHAIDREYRVLSALEMTGVPVPKLLHYCESEAVIGTPFYLMERVEGRIFADSSLSDAPRNHRRQMYTSAAEVLAAIHGIDIVAAGLESFGKHSRYLERQLARWSNQWKLSDIGGIPKMELLIQWLSANIPPDDEVALVHGDFRIGNLIFHPNEPRIIAVLDWELSTLGDAMTDIAHCCVYGWYIKPEEYGGLLGGDLHSQGLPSMRDFVRDYMQAAGTSKKLSRYHLVFALFRNSVIFAGIAARARDGNAFAENATEIGKLAPQLASRAISLIENEDEFPEQIGTT